MKHDPILPSIYVSAMQIPPKRMVPSLEKIGSSDYMVGEILIALLLHGLCVLIALWCMEIPKHNNPFYSTIEVAYEAPVALPIPQEVSTIDASDLSAESVAEPSIVASEALPETDSIAQIPVSKPQKPAPERKKVPLQPQTKSVNKQPADHVASIQAQSTGTSHTATKSAQTAIKNLSPSQRCSSVSKEYPMAAKRRHEEGTAQVSYQLLADGQKNQVEVVESTGYSDLDRAAVQAVQAMKCQAAPGQPVIKVNIPVIFSLNK